MGRKSFSFDLIAGNIAQWFPKYGRDLPWRKTKNPYAIWISEIMLQQTQVDRVKTFYERFLKRFPDVDFLAQASWEEVLEYWRGLGYYRRAKSLHETAKIIVKEYGGKFPSDFDELQKLPGIGLYTAAAIASFAFSQNIPALDTNLRRVFGRLLGERFLEKSSLEQFEFLRSFFARRPNVRGSKKTNVSQVDGALFNHALMDIGATICVSKKPLCHQCPFQSFCNFFTHPPLNDGEYKSDSSQKVLMLADANAKKFKKQKPVKVAVGVVIQAGKVLISQRLPHVSFGNFWEFPGGKLEAGEDERTCLKRELQEELAIEVSVRPPFYRAQTEHQGRHFLLTFHRCSILLGTPKALQVKDFRWVVPEKLFDYQFPPVNQEVIEILLKKKAMFRV